MKLNYSFARGWTRLFALILIIVSALGSINIAGCCMLSIGYVRLICPASFMGEKVARTIKKRIPSSWFKHFNHWIKKIQKHVPQPDYKDALALTCGTFIGIWIFRYPFISIFCPLGVLSRNIIELLTHFRLRYDLFFIVLPGLAATF